MNRVSRSGFMSAYVLSAFALLLLGSCDRSQPVAVSSGPAEVPYGTKISFERGGNSEPYKTTGWSITEEKFTWSEGTAAQLQISVPATTDPVTLRVRMAAMVKPPELPFQPVEMYINDQKIAEWQVAETAEVVARVPPDLTKDGGVLSIDIKTPKATSPKALGISADPRVLGVCVFELQFAKG